MAKRTAPKTENTDVFWYCNNKTQGATIMKLTTYLLTYSMEQSPS